MEQPEGYVDKQHSGYVCKLIKSLYGLKQAPRAWYDKLKLALKGWGFRNSRADTSLFVFRKQKSVVLLIVYVDDILLTGNDSTLLSQVVHDLNKYFASKYLSELSYFLGFEASRTDNEISLTQSKYAYDLLLRTGMVDCTTYPTPMSTGAKLSREDGEPLMHPTLYRSTVGALQCLTLTRPDISFAVNRLSQYLASPTVVHW